VWASGVEETLGDGEMDKSTEARIFHSYELLEPIAEQREEANMDDYCCYEGGELPATGANAVMNTSSTVSELGRVPKTNLYATPPSALQASSRSTDDDKFTTSDEEEDEGNTTDRRGFLTKGSGRGSSVDLDDEEEEEWDEEEDEEEERNLMATDRGDLGRTRDSIWNQRFQDLVRQKDDENKYQQISYLAHDFQHAAEVYGRTTSSIPCTLGNCLAKDCHSHPGIIISERFLPVEQKTIKPLDIGLHPPPVRALLACTVLRRCWCLLLGGIAGGEKFIVQSILYPHSCSIAISFS